MPFQRLVVMCSEFRARKALERLIGPRLMPYILHLRPMEWPIMTVHFLLGAVLAVGLRLPPGRTALAWFVFIVLLNGGTLALNSAFDQDQGDIGYLRQPPRPPRHLALVSALMLAAGLGLGFLLPPLFAWSNAACTAMSVLYSVPPVRLKARAGWDLLINCAGFGLLTPLAGWGLTGLPLPRWMLGVAIGFGFLFGALYPTTQIYQVEEDRARGDRTLVIVLGEAASLAGAALLAVLAHLWFAWAALGAHRSPLPLLVSLAAWMAVLLPWWAQWRRWSPVGHQAGMYCALGAWAVTDASLLALLWPR
jgi:4-hydroxybenzoate polyprenyltransferase